MRKFSWHTSKVKYEGNGCYVTNKVHHALTNFAYSECVEHYRPNMKGGHTHNHIYNKCHKHIFRSKQARKNVDRKDKPEFVRIFYMNLKLGNYSFDKLLHTIFHHNKCARTAKKDLRKR